METTITERLREFVSKFYNGNASEFGRKNNLPQGTVSNYISGKTKPSLEVIQAVLLNHLSISAEWLLRGKGSMELSMMDRLAMKLDGGCGCGNDSIFDNEIHNSTVSNGDGGYKALADNLQKRCESLEEQNKSLIEIINNLSKK